MDWTPVYKCPACEIPMDIFPCTSCGRKLRKEEEAHRDALVVAAGGRDTLEYIQVVGALNETIEKCRYACPTCGKKGDTYPCPACGHKLTENQEQDLKENRKWIEANEHIKYSHRLTWESHQMGKLMGEYNSHGEPIPKSGGCLILAFSLCGLFFSALVCWLIVL